MLPLVDFNDFYTFGNLSVSCWMLHLLLPFYVMCPHSPLQTKVGKTMPKGISESAIGLWVVLMHILQESEW